VDIGADEMAGRGATHRRLVHLDQVHKELVVLVTLAAEHTLDVAQVELLLGVVVVVAGELTAQLTQVLVLHGLALAQTFHVRIGRALSRL